MSEIHLASIIISSYNYGPFVGKAIESALNQTYPHKEIIVVDDGSTDNSREIIAGYGDSIIPILKDNGGQASAFNAGFKISRGQVIFFVDSDDMLLSSAVEKAMQLFQDPEVAKVHWPLEVVDIDGRNTGRTIGTSLPEGDLREAVINCGPFGYYWTVTTGNAWIRRFIEQVFPMPEEEYKICPDLYLSGLAPLYGTIKKIAKPQSLWRDHGDNSSYRESFDERLRVNLWREERCLETLAAHCRALGINVNAKSWKTHSWWHQIHSAIQDMTVLIPQGETLILVDEDEWATDEIIAGRRRVPFLERDGIYWGPPPDAKSAIQELERLRQSGAHFIGFAWQTFWWLDYYFEFNRYLRLKFRCLLENDRCVVFDLR
jgi:glycosyltransferase involved in cell wall biosynthesis